MQDFLNISFATERCILSCQAQIHYGIYQKKVLDNITLFKKLWTMNYYYTINEYRIEMQELFLSKPLGIFKVEVKWDYNITWLVKNINILGTCKSII